jgi:type I restriction enzyme, S subunit
VTRIDDLIADLCPLGVERRRIGDVARVGTGSSDRKDASEGGKHPFYVRSKDVLRIDDYEFDEQAIVIPGEGGIGDIFHYVSGKYALHQRAYRISFTATDIDAKFAFYYFTAAFKAFILSRAVSATVTSIRKPMITDFRIPVPPLEVQREIVRVLDTFTDLETELEAELEARRHQYEHYRRTHLMFPETVRTIALGDVCKVFNGYPFKSEFFNSDGDGLPLIRIRDINTGFSATFYSGDYDERYVVNDGDILIGMDGDFRATRWLHGQALLNQRVCRLQDFSEDVDPTFVFFLVRRAIAKIQETTQASTVKHLSSKQLEALVIPVPPRAEQKNIAHTLDRFDALVNDLSIGLPAELKARRLQYEHYRDRLLTFPEAA